MHTYSDKHAGPFSPSPLADCGVCVDVWKHYVGIADCGVSVDVWKQGQKFALWGQGAGQGCAVQVDGAAR